MRDSVTSVTGVFLHITHSKNRSIFNIYNIEYNYKKKSKRSEGAKNTVTLVTLSRFRGGGIFLVRKILLPNWTIFFG